MNEIEKLYENAGVEKKIMCDWTCNCGGKFSDYCNVHCLHYEDNDLYYPPFTAEKQIELIKWLGSKYGLYIVDKYSIGAGTCIGEFCTKENFEEALAGFINSLWQDLTKEEKEQIRSMLNG